MDVSANRQEQPYQPVTVFRTLVLGAFVSFWVACSASKSATFPSSLFSFSGNVSAGAVNGATILIYSVNNDGSLGTELGSGTTDGSGNFTATLTSAPTGPVV